MISAPENFNLVNFTFDQYLEFIKDKDAGNDHVLTPVTENLIISSYVFAITFGLIANAVICFVIAKTPSLRTTRNMYIANLSFSDIVMCLVCVPFTLVRILLRNWNLGLALCKLIPWLQGTVVFSSTITITAIAMDRYRVLLNLNSAGDTAFHFSATFTIAVIWIASSLIALPLFIYTQLETHGNEETTLFSVCLEVWPSPWKRFAYAAVIMLLQFAIPLAILSTLHWKICTILKYRINVNPRSYSEMRRAMNDARRHSKNTAMLMTITIMFALCWFPLTSLNLIADFDQNIFLESNFLLTFTVSHLLAMLSACINPVLYGWFNATFRREFVRTLFFWRKCEVSDVMCSEAEKETPVSEAERVVVYNRNVSFKAVQTEVQPEAELGHLRSYHKCYGTIPYSK